MPRAQWTHIMTLVASLAIHGLVAWFAPSVRPTAESPAKRPERRIVARTLPKPKPAPTPEPKPEPKPAPTPEPKPAPKPEPKPENIAEVTKAPEPAAPSPAPKKKTTEKRAPKRRSGRNLTSKRARPGTREIAPGSQKGGPKNIGDWDPSGPSGPGPIDPQGGDEDGTRVERPTTDVPAPVGPTSEGSTPKKRAKKRPKLRPAVPVYRPTPRWPPGLIKSGPITVTVRATIDEKGTLISAKALGSAPKLAKSAAVAFVKTIRWRAGRLGENNAKSTVVYTVKFRP